MLKPLVYVSLAWLWLSHSSHVAAESAEQLFARYQPALLQVRVVENASTAKAAIGTGFVIDIPANAAAAVPVQADKAAAGNSENTAVAAPMPAASATAHPQRLVVTNYHVVSEAVLFPDKYQLQYLDYQEQKGSLQVVAVDVINDLALLSTDYQPSQLFRLAAQAPVQGASLFSLGNPHDLGMMLVPGTYNGLQKSSYYPRVHFTGAINSGMSGGPTVDANGDVVGVNVASAGNQLGFLVPVDSLTKLVASYQADTQAVAFKQHIQTQLQQNQAQMLDKILQAQWQLKDFGNGQVPDEVVPFVRCWGESNLEKSDDKLKEINAFCSQSDEIYLSPRLTTGRIEMQFSWLQGANMHPLQFYRRYQARIQSLTADNQASKEDVTPFRCQNQVVTNAAGRHAKTILCVRAYRHYDDLFDALYLAAAVDGQQQGMISHYTLSGVSQPMAQAFLQKFSGAVTWQ